MKFSVIIGNPPYQLEDGGGGSLVKSAIPLYNEFIMQAIKLNPKYISMIIPSRWMCGGKQVLSILRNHLVESHHMREIHNYKKAYDVFDDVDISGGVQYFLYSTFENFGETTIYNYERVGDELKITFTKRKLSQYNYKDDSNNSQYMVVADNNAIHIINKVLDKQETSLSSMVSRRRPFGLSSDFKGSSETTEVSNIKVICSSGRTEYTSLDTITSGKQMINKWKVCVSKVSAEGGTFRGDVYNVLSKPFILKPLEVCTESYLVIGYFDTEAEANGLVAFLKLKLIRFLILQTITSMNLTFKNFLFVPIKRFNHLWTDKELYDFYDISESEVDYIERVIREIK